MNSVYESLRALLRAKELEIKKLEKEIEALRIVLPIVAEAGTNGVDSETEKHVAKFAGEASGNGFEPVTAGSKASSGSVNIPAPDLTPKSRTNWP